MQAKKKDDFRRPSMLKFKLTFPDKYPVLGHAKRGVVAEIRSITIAHQLAEEKFTTK